MSEHRSLSTFQRDSLRNDLACFQLHPRVSRPPSAQPLPRYLKLCLILSNAYILERIPLLLILAVIPIRHILRHRHRHLSELRWHVRTDRVAMASSIAVLVMLCVEYQCRITRSVVIHSTTSLGPVSAVSHAGRAAAVVGTGARRATVFEEVGVVGG